MDAARAGLAGAVPSGALEAQAPDLPVAVKEPSAEEILARRTADEEAKDAQRRSADFPLEEVGRAQSAQGLPVHYPIRRDDSIATPAARHRGRRIFKQAISAEEHMPNSPAGTLLCVRVIEAKNLVDRDHVSKNDPYVVLRVGENCSFSEIHNEAGSEVVFNWEAKFPISDQTKEAPGLVVSVIDHDTYTRDDLIGTCAPDPFAYMFARSVNPFRAWYQLTRLSHFRKREKNSGEVLLELWYESFEWPNSVEDDVRRTLRWISPFPLPRLRLVTNWNFRAGMARKLLDGGHFRTFRTFQVNLWEVNSTFKHSTCSWNSGYDKAQQIYGSGISAKMVRAGIHMQHRWLYSKNDSEAGQFKIIHVCGIRQLFEALDYGRNAEGKSVRYTYVIMPDGTLHFSKTSRHFGQDLLSKHALHCNCSREVIYAGELFIDLNSERFQSSKLPALVIDNNSGTFAPTPAKLLNLRALLELNFGHEFPIFALDRDDHRLKLWFEQNNLD